MEYITYIGLSADVRSHPVATEDHQSILPNGELALLTMHCARECPSRKETEYAKQCVNWISGSRRLVNCS